MEHKCPKCGVVQDRSEFYERRDRKGGIVSYCKTCNRIVTRDRLRKIKQQCVDYLGGKCSVCGYNKNIAALDFHHTDPSIKDFAIGTRNKNFDDIKLELDKCVLLCANCHRERHAMDA